MQYAFRTSARSLWSELPGWKILSSGNVAFRSRSMASNQERSLQGSCSPDFANRMSMSRDRCRAFSNVELLRASSFPMALSQTSARDRGATPLHHNSRVRGSRRTRSQSGRTCSSQSRWRVFWVSSLAHCTDATSAALRFSRVWKYQRIFEQI